MLKPLTSQQVTWSYCTLAFFSSLNSQEPSLLDLSKSLP
jgi:hypothetical protein